MTLNGARAHDGVIPAHAGIHFTAASMDSGLRWHDTPPAVARARFDTFKIDAAASVARRG
jgi:hypothetical protein